MHVTTSSATTVAHLGDDLRVGDERAREADHVGRTVDEDLLGELEVGDPAGDDHGHAVERGTDRRRERHVGAGGVYEDATYASCAPWASPV